MSDLKWGFPPLSYGAEQGINDSGIATFKGSEMYDRLAREICQNSLDAKNPNEDTVIVKFNDCKLKISDFPALSGLKDVFKSCRKYWKNSSDTKLTDFLDEADRVISQEEIDCLIISDYNTIGLSGAKAKYGQSSVWRALTHSNGVTEKSSGSAGSHGIGKNAPYACSNLRTVFYNTFSFDDGIKAFQGVSRLVTHYDDDEKPTQGVGFFQSFDGINYSPIFEKDDCKLRDQFSRNEYGTDVIIAGLKIEDDWESVIEKAVLENFFYAIHKKMLVVEINGQVINHQNIKDRIIYYVGLSKKEGIVDEKLTSTYEFYLSVTEPDYETSGTIIDQDDVHIFLKKGDDYCKRIAEMRSSGMLIRSRGKNMYNRYAAVMIVNEGKLNDLLKKTEPPQHDKWDPGIIDDTNERRNAEYYKRALIKWASTQIEENCKSDLPDEIDLDGVSAYLPFDYDDQDLGTNDSQSDSPDADETALIDVVEKKKNNKKVQLTAKKVQGRTDDNAEPHNETNGGQGQGNGGIEDSEGDKDVTAPKEGNKTLNIPKVISQRIVQMPTPNVYRITFMLEEDCPSLKLKVNAIGEDAHKEDIIINDYRINKEKHLADSSVITLNDIKANEYNEVFLTLQYSEKMLLELLMY